MKSCSVDIPIGGMTFRNEIGGGTKQDAQERIPNENRLDSPERAYRTSSSAVRWRADMILSAFLRSTLVSGATATKTNGARR